MYSVRLLSIEILYDLFQKEIYGKLISTQKCHRETEKSNFKTIPIRIHPHHFNAC